VAILSRPPKTYVANVGDSRGYLWSRGELFCVTSDDTWVNQVGRGLGLSDEQLQKHPYRNVLTRAIGAEDHLEVKAQELDLLPGDLLLLCSDGLHNVAGETALLEIVAGPGSLKEKCEALVAAAVERGAPDNITAVLLEISEDPEIGVLVLGAGSDKAGPGPLVTLLTKSAGTLPVPITIVPGELSKERLQELT
jgi:protein phosphatase